MDDKTRQRIAQRAYELFLARGGYHGYHMEDWVKAEQEIAGKSGKAAAPKAPAVKKSPKR